MNEEGEHFGITTTILILIINISIRSMRPKYQLLNEIFLVGNPK